MSTSILEALLGKLDIKRHSPSILYISASLAMSTSILEALLGKLDIKRHSPSILYILIALLSVDLLNVVYLTALLTLLGQHDLALFEWGWNDAKIGN